MVRGIWRNSTRLLRGPGNSFLAYEATTEIGKAWRHVGPANQVNIDHQRASARARESMTKELKKMAYNAARLSLTGGWFNRYNVGLISHCRRGNQTPSKGLSKGRYT